MEEVRESASSLDKKNRYGCECRYRIRPKGSENIEEKHKAGAGRETCKEFRNRHAVILSVQKGVPGYGFCKHPEKWFNSPFGVGFRRYYGTSLDGLQWFFHLVQHFHCFL
jgi:hypothetical protein